MTENGDSEGDLVMTADLATLESIALMIRNSYGIISMEDVEIMMISMMSQVMKIGNISTAALTRTVVRI